MREINITKTGNFEYDFQNKDAVHFIVNCDCELNINAQNANLNFVFTINNSKVKLNYFFNDKVSIKEKLVLNNADININQLSLLVNAQIDSKITLNESSVNLNHRGFTKNKLKKQVQIIHQTRDSFSHAHCLVIGSNGANIDLLLDAHVQRKCSHAKAFQKTKVIALDEQVQATLQPILKTDHHQITAQHAAVFSKITDEEMYYLQSRGFTQQQAKELIVKSLLINGNEKFYQKIEELVI